MCRLYAAFICVFLANLSSGQEKTKERFRQVADRMVKAINAADYEAVRQDFNKVMLNEFPVEKCRTFFSKEISGKYSPAFRLRPARCGRRWQDAQRGRQSK